MCMTSILALAMAMFIFAVWHLSIRFCGSRQSQRILTSELKHVEEGALGIQVTEPATYSTKSIYF